MKNETYSREHLLYLRGRRRSRIAVWMRARRLLVIFLSVWELIAAFQLVDPFIISSPSRIWKAIVDLYRNGTLFYHIGTTLWETLLGFAVAVVAGTIIALLLWWSDTVRKVLEPYIVVLNSLPKIALGPVIIVWFGTGSKAIVFMTILVGIIVVILNMLAGFLADPTKTRCFFCARWALPNFRYCGKLVIPSALPAFISMLKISVGMAWIGSIMGEYIVSKAGLGYLIVYGGQVFKLDLVMAATFILCILAAAMYFMVVLLEKDRHQAHVLISFTTRFLKTRRYRCGHARSYLACPFLFALRGDARRSRSLKSRTARKTPNTSPNAPSAG